MTIFKEKKLSDVLNWIPNIKRIKPIDIKRYTVEQGEKYPFYGQQLINNGVVDYISVDKRFLNNKEKNVYLLIASNNHSISIVTTPFYIKEDHAATSTLGHPRMTVKSALYINGSIQKVFDTSFDYNAKALQGILQNTKVTLPCSDEDSNELDWKYMELYVDELKNKNIKQIKKFLSDKGYEGVENTNLKEEDYAILEKNKKIQFQSFGLGDLFDTIKRGKRIKSLDRIEGELPFFTAGVEGMGFSDYIGNEEAEVFPQNSLTIDMFGNTYYRGYKYGADDHVTILYHSNNIYSKRVLQYMQTQINHTLHNKFSYSRNFYPSDAYDVEIKLPIIKKDVIDFVFIENYMIIIEKKILNTLLNKI